MPSQPRPTFASFQVPIGVSKTNIKREFSQSLLKVEVPVCVLLAQKSIPVHQILKLVPGAMIQFDKGCDSPLHVEVGGQKIAAGEAVKVGDKFGLRIAEILERDERFIPLTGPDTKSP